MSEKEYVTFQEALNAYYDGKTIICADCPGDTNKNANDRNGDETPCEFSLKCHTNICTQSLTQKTWTIKEGD
jgi:hypothetical protein